MRRLRDALGKGDWFSELFALSGLAWAVAEIIVVKINLSPFSSQREVLDAVGGLRDASVRAIGLASYSL